MQITTDFWRKLDQLVATSKLKIDRPKRSAHPRHPALIYPFDYGYLAGTGAADGDGVDVWVGGLAEKKVTGVICTVDLDQRDAEVKILLGCTAREAQEMLRVHNAGSQAGVLIERLNNKGRDF